MSVQTNSFLIENHFAIVSEEELVKSFRLRDQKKLILPNNLQYPLNARSYFSWKESSGTYTYLVFKMPNWDMPRGVVFKRSNPVGELTGGLCDWCHSYGPSDEIGMLSVTMSSTVSASYFLCQNLNCIEKIEDTSMLSGKSPEKYIAQLYHKMEKFFEGLSNYKPD
ncbi:MAG: FBP domain-containing protein [Bdellovibrio sp.]